MVAAGRSKERDAAVPSRGPAWLWLAVAAIGVVALVLALNGRFPGPLDEQGGLPRLLYLLSWLLLAGGGMVLAVRREPLKQLRNAAIWLGLGLALVIGYSFKDELGSRLLGELMPQRGVANPDGSVTFRAGQDGHFHVEALINGTRLRLLVDTGASQVVLSPSDARRLGIATASLDFRHVSETANGPVSGAPVTLREIAVGAVRLNDVAASVNGAEMSESLLGMTFLSRLSGFEVSGDRLTLRQ
jgi:aspartyl protease family protein